MDYQGQNPNLGETVNTPNVSGGESQFLPSRDMGELGRSIVENTPAIEEVMNGEAEIKVEDREQPPLVPGEKPTTEVATKPESTAVNIVPSNIMTKNNSTISREMAEAAIRVAREVARSPHDAVDDLGRLNGAIYEYFTGREFGDDAPRDKAA